MSTTTILPPPPLLANNPNDPTQQYLLRLQQAQPLVTVDSSRGAVTIVLPPAGVNSAAATGQSNQNFEMTILKTSSDANHVVVKGAFGGTITLTAQSPNAGSGVVLKSDATHWYVKGRV